MFFLHIVADNYNMYTKKNNQYYITLILKSQSHVLFLLSDVKSSYPAMT